MPGLNFGSPMKPLGQMWAQHMGQFPQMGQMPSMGAPQMGQGAPSGQFPLNAQGGQMMTPGGGSTGAPMQGNPQLQMGQMPMQGQLPSYQMPQQGKSAFDQQGFQAAQMGWQQQRPDMMGGNQHQAMMDYRAMRPDRQSFFG